MQDDEDLDMSELKTHIEKLLNSTNNMIYRLDSIERMMEQNMFDFDSLKVKIAKGQNEEHVRTLIGLLDLNESNMTIGTFLRALNRYLIREALVDLNDLEIYITPELYSAFYIKDDGQKVPYIFLLLGLSQMFTINKKSI